MSSFPILLSLLPHSHSREALSQALLLDKHKWCYSSNSQQGIRINCQSHNGHNCCLDMSGHGSVFFGGPYSGLWEEKKGECCGQEWAALGIISQAPIHILCQPHTLFSDFRMGRRILVAMALDPGRHRIGALRVLLQKLTTTTRVLSSPGRLYICCLLFWPPRFCPCRGFGLYPFLASDWAPRTSAIALRLWRWEAMRWQGVLIGVWLVDGVSLTV